MQADLTRLTPIKGGNILEVLTVERMSAIQNAILELSGKKGFAGGPLLIPAGRAGSSAGRFKVTYDPGNNRLGVFPGCAVHAAMDAGGTVLRPFEPTLNNIPLSEVPKPYWTLAGGSGEMEVVCVFDHYKARMVLKQLEADLELNGCERAWQVAKITFPEDDSVKIEQTWQSDIVWFDPNESCDSSSHDSSAGSDGSNDTSHSDHSGGDSGGSGSSHSSDSSHSSEESSGSDGEGDTSSESTTGDCTEPRLSGLKVFIYDIGGNGPDCFVDAVTLTPVILTVVVTVTGLPANCAGKLAIKFSFGPHSVWKSVFANGEVSGEFGFITGGVNLFACSNYEVDAEVSPGVGINSFCKPTKCRVSMWYMTPGLCANGGSCDGGSSSSSSSSSAP